MCIFITHTARRKIFILQDPTRTRGLVLLTGDGHLRQAARREGVEVHGVLWVLDGLLEDRGLTAREAIQALRRMLDAGARLPEPEWRRRLRAWTAQR